MSRIYYYYYGGSCDALWKIIDKFVLDVLFCFKRSGKSGKYVDNTDPPPPPPLIRRDYILAIV